MSGTITMTGEEYDALRAEAEALRGLTPELPPRPPEGAGLPRYGLRWNGPAQPLSVPMDDGYWTPWHLAEALRAENGRLRLAMHRLVTTHCAAALKSHATDAELEQYLSAGIAQLEAECERLRAQVSALQSDANSWQSGYDKGREDGAKGWKSQHARDSAELRRLCAERDHLKACQENAQLHITGLVAERNAALWQLYKLSGLLRHASSVLGIQGWDALTHEIDTALSELTP